MAKTLQNFIDAVTGHLGNRSGGMIGTQSMADSITSSVNNAITFIALQRKFSLFDKLFTVAAVSGTQTYSIPTEDTSGTVQRIRNLYGIQYISSSGSGYVLRCITPQRMERHLPQEESPSSGIPYYYSVYGSTFKVYPIPDESATFNVQASVWPKTISSISEYSPYGEEFDLAIEQYAAYECFAKLQQTLDANLWVTRFNKTLRFLIYAHSEDPDLDFNLVDSPNSLLSVSDPVNNPMVRSYN